MDRRAWLAGTGAFLAGSKALQPRRADFPLAETRTYLNNAGYHPMSVMAARAVQDYLARRSEGTREPAWDVSAGVKQAFAALINARPAGVSYVTSTMVGENLVVAGLGIRPGAGNVVTDALHFFEYCGYPLQKC